MFVSCLEKVNMRPEPWHLEGGASTVTSRGDSGSGRISPSLVTESWSLVVRVVAKERKTLNCPWVGPLGYCSWWSVGVDGVKGDENGPGSSSLVIGLGHLCGVSFRICKLICPHFTILRIRTESSRTWPPVVKWQRRGVPGRMWLSYPGCLIPSLRVMWRSARMLLFQPGRWWEGQAHPRAARPSVPWALSRCHLSQPSRGPTQVQGSSLSTFSGASVSNVTSVF